MIDKDDYFNFMDEGFDAMVRRVISGHYFHPSKGYEDAKAYLEYIGEWEHVSTHGFSVDGWSIIASANAIWKKRDGGDGYGLLYN